MLQTCTANDVPQSSGRRRMNRGCQQLKQSTFVMKAWSVDGMDKYETKKNNLKIKQTCFTYWNTLLLWPWQEHCSSFSLFFLKEDARRAMQQQFRVVTLKLIRSLVQLHFLKEVSHILDLTDTCILIKNVLANFSENTRIYKVYNK